MIAGQDGTNSFAYDELVGLSLIPPFPNRTPIWAEDVNRFGQVVGSGYRLKNGHSFQDAFIWDRVNGTRTFADFGYEAHAYGINDLGDVVGDYFTPGSNAFFWRPGQGWIPLAPLYPGGPSAAYKINNLSQVLGSARMSSGVWTTLIWLPDGSIVDLGNYPGQDQNFAFDLNNRGYVCGAATGNLGTFGYIWAPNGSYTGIFNPYGSGYLDTTGMNDTGYAIGSLIHPTLGWKGYIRYPNGTIKLLNDLLDASSQGWDVREAWDINNTGQISAAGYKNGQRRGLLLHPVLSPPQFNPSGPP